ncbi:MAG: nucleotide disphospho-sugar-binding domain-containing protein [Acetobacteraceae bacterium]
MKILMASTPATGHINPLATIARFLVEDGHEVIFLSGTAYRGRIESSGAKFQALPGKADADLQDILAVAPELEGVEPGLDWLRIALERIFVDRVADQHKGLQEVLRGFPADAIVADDMYFGLLPMLLGPRANRPAVLVCGTSILHCRRDDGAPLFVGLPPAVSQAQFKEYEGIASEYGERVDQPSLAKLNLVLNDLGVGPLSVPIFEGTVLLADTYMQLSVPSFEFPRAFLPPSVNFIGALPIIPGQAPLPSWAADLDGKRKVVLVTQGTVANHDFGLLVGPTLAALANEPDILVVATAGGRPIDAIPGPIPSNARLAKYLPFEWLLPKVDVLVTNGGYGSVNQALSFGIPIIAAGMTEDKADVNARIAWSGAGMNLRTNNPTPEAIQAAVRTALDAPIAGGTRSAWRPNLPPSTPGRRLCACCGAMRVSASHGRQ